MDGSFPRTLLLVCLALSGCATDSLDSTAPWTSPSSLELRRLPVDSKVYFRRRMAIPARTARIAIFPPTGVSAFTTELALESADVDRVIKTTTPLLVDRIASSDAPGSRGRCAVTLFLRTSGGEAMRLRTAPSGTSRSCSPPTIGDIADIAIVVPSPPVPIE